MTYKIIDELDFTKIKNFHETQCQETKTSCRQKISVKYKADKGLLSNTYEECLKLSNKKINQHRNGEKT